LAITLALPGTSIKAETGFMRDVYTACNFKETLINSEFPQHMDVLPFSMAEKPLKMKNKIKSH